MKQSLLILSTTLMALNISIAQNAQVINQLNGKTIKTQNLSTDLQRIVDTGHIAGLSVAIIQNSQTVYAHTFGFKNLEKQEKMDTNTVIYAGSFTKPFFSTLFLQLVDKGIFELDKPIVQYLKKSIETYPKWQTLAHEKDLNKITARMILSHSSGMPILRYIYGDSLYLIAKPGEKLYYSNEGFNFLGFIVEEFTGKTLDNWAKELIYEPLNMHHSGLVWHSEFKDNHATGHDSEGKVFGVQVKENARAAGSLVTTTSDYGKFLTVLFQKQLLSKILSNEMLKPQFKVTSFRGFGPLRDSISNQFAAMNFSWSLGMMCFDTPYGKAYAHGCHLDGWQSYWVVYPQKNTILILMSNSDNMEKNIYNLLEKTIGDVYSPMEWSTGIPCTIKNN